MIICLCLKRVRPVNNWLFSVLYPAEYCASLCSMEIQHFKLSEREIAEAWAKITIQRKPPATSIFCD